MRRRFRVCCHFRNSFKEFGSIITLFTDCNDNSLHDSCDLDDGGSTDGSVDPASGTVGADGSGVECVIDVPGQDPVTENCGDGVDDNCDGLVDDEDGDDRELSDLDADVEKQENCRHEEDRGGDADRMRTLNLAAAAALVVIGILGVRMARDRAVEEVAPAASDADSGLRLVAVLPLRNLGPAEDEFFAEGITEDPADDMFIACALEAKADYIVARDPHLRNLKHFHGIQIIDVTTFIEKVKEM